jgi:transposase
MVEKNKLVNGIIYCHTNIITGKQYIGQTNRTLKERMGKDFKGYSNKNKSGNYTHFYKSISKHGPEKFTTEILFEAQIYQYALNFLEQWYIFTYDTVKNGYNETIGGRNYTQAEETKKKISDGHLKDRTKATKEELTELYINKFLSAVEIGEIFGVSDVTIGYWLIGYGIPVRTISEAHLKNRSKATKEELVELYIIQGLSTYEIGEIFAVCNTTIGRWLKEYGIHIKTPAEAKLKGKPKAIKEELIDLYIIQGLTTTEIGKMFNVSYTAINNWLREYGIPIKTNSEVQLKGRYKPTKEELEDLSVKKKLTTKELSIMFNVSTSTIRRWLKEYLIQLR